MITYEIEIEKKKKETNNIKKRLTEDSEFILW